MHIDLTLGDNRLIATQTFSDAKWHVFTVDMVSGNLEQSVWSDTEFKAVVQTMLLGDDVPVSIYRLADVACGHLTKTRPIP
jgi:hypothetical protein